MKNRGFTLIELVVVIVVLAILAVVAAPRFLSIAGDARVASLQGLQAGLKSGSAIVYGKAVLDGVDEGNQYLDVDGDGSGDISLRAGYPRVASSCNTFLNGLAIWMTMNVDASCQSNSGADWYGVVEQNMFHFFPSGFTDTSENCYVTYVTASEYVGGQWIDKDTADVTSVTSGCGQ